MCFGNFKFGLSWDGKKMFMIIYVIYQRICATRCLFDELLFSSLLTHIRSLPIQIDFCTVEPSFGMIPLLAGGLQLFLYFER